MSKDFLQVEHDEGSHEGISSRLVLIDVSECEVNLLIGEIVHNYLQVA